MTLGWRLGWALLVGAVAWGPVWTAQAQPRNSGQAPDRRAERSVRGQRGTGRGGDNDDAKPRGRHVRLTPEQRQRLRELRKRDPEAYRRELERLRGARAARPAPPARRDERGAAGAPARASRITPEERRRLRELRERDPEAYRRELERLRARRARGAVQQRGRSAVRRAGAPGQRARRRIDPIEVTERRLARTQDAHNRRIAELRRIIEVAKSQGDTDTVRRAQALIDRENEVFEQQRQRIEKHLAALRARRQGARGHAPRTPATDAANRRVAPAAHSARPVRRPADRVRGGTQPGAPSVPSSPPAGDAP